MDSDLNLGNNQQPEDYYNDKNKKYSDTGLGCVSGILFAAIMFGIAVTSYRSATVIIILATIAAIIAILLSFIKGRRFIGIGLLLSIVLPLVIFGGCILIFHPFK
jgi:hypothetical protein